MANEKMEGIPSVPGDSTTWTAFVDQFETMKKGDSPLNLTEWARGNTARPQIAAGSAIEIAGGAYRFTAQTAITDESGLSSGRIHLMVKANDPDANSATPYFTNTDPVWRDDLNGWYDATGDGRYTGHEMTWDGASSYTYKRFRNNSKELSYKYTEPYMMISSEIGLVDRAGMYDFIINLIPNTVGRRLPITGDFEGLITNYAEVVTSTQIDMHCYFYTGAKEIRPLAPDSVTSSFGEFTCLL